VQNDPVRSGGESLRSSLRLRAILFACLTCCGLSCLDAAELFQLQDDTSNDYISSLRTVSDSSPIRSRDADGRPPIIRLDLLQQKGNAKPKVPQPGFVGAGSSRSVADLLHFLSVQRT
jgi:hypothetical protein